ncbi:hypothetical protein KAFR_0K01300 [Kazachstania africana CBS 2517]|uniref:Mitochondrial morphogenesis protein SLD7 n=1 Tax=Kazachstania africana (strain ATCC 22294 / BCRC 22015 / CBS 2517 / CECT 1963 / NBRC 1671 / NRRL Y-8276) TaxID=1071382 RepID=H2B1I4_KAZAF|nr:hypothetical protein KAFR_0K01300 [Kazachstania africana CBS 2517]CCF60484.1 hypothetical protein KAFR_0K01300 [Kazachstania africana CBS 2517]
MLDKVAILSFNLGERRNSITIRDVQLWKDVADRATRGAPKKMKGKFMQYVDLAKLPIWVKDESEMLCYSTSSTTVGYFTSKLKDENRGIVVNIAKNGNEDPSLEFAVIYRDVDTIKCFALDTRRKMMIDARISNIVKQQNTVNFDDIIEQSHRRKIEASNKVQKSVQINDKRLQFNETLSRLILGGLRLRGIPNTQIGFQKLFKMTFQAAEFAHREELKTIALSPGASPPSEDNNLLFERLQETVETLLTLFTRS